MQLKGLILLFIHYSLYKLTFSINRCNYCSFY